MNKKCAKDKTTKERRNSKRDGSNRTGSDVNRPCFIMISLEQTNSQIQSEQSIPNRYTDTHNTTKPAGLHKHPHKHTNSEKKRKETKSKKKNETFH